jgi:hypothetical protein
MECNMACWGEADKAGGSQRDQHFVAARRSRRTPLPGHTARARDAAHPPQLLRLLRFVGVITLGV